MILSDLYVTDISCNTYNMSIENTLKVTVTLTDYNDEPIVGKEVSVFTSNGVFLESDSKGFVGETDDDGVVEVTYKPSDWGNHIISSNDSSVQVHVVGGWKPIENINKGVQLESINGYYNQDTVRLEFIVKNSVINENETIATLPNIDFIKPSKVVCFPAHLANKAEFYLNSNGELKGCGSPSNINKQYMGVYYARSKLV